MKKAGALIVTHLVVAVASLTLATIAAWGQERTVAVARIDREIDPATVEYVARALQSADELGASAVVIELNTFGGRVDAATRVRDMLLDARLPVVAFVNPRAISAGALIALAADSIIMVPGASMGAATPINGDGSATSEKVVSYMRGEMRATAERSGRNPKIAEAMVDPGIDLGDSLDDAGRLLTLTSDEALRVGYADGTAPSLDAVVRWLGGSAGSTVVIEVGFEENLLSFLTAPLVSSILIMLGLGGLLFTVKTGHLSAGTAIGLVSLALFFGVQYVSDVATLLEILAFTAGVILIALEIFVIPGFGVAGISGILLLIGALFLSLVGSFDTLTAESMMAPLYTLAGALVGVVALFLALARYLPSTSIFGRLALVDVVGGGSSGYDLELPMVGAEGRALTTLRPAGVVEIDEVRVDVVTQGEFVAAGEEIVVVGVDGRRVIVARRPVVQSDPSPLHG